MHRLDVDIDTDLCIYFIITYHKPVAFHISLSLFLLLFFYFYKYRFQSELTTCRCDVNDARRVSYTRRTRDFRETAARLSLFIQFLFKIKVMLKFLLFLIMNKHFG